MADPATSVSTGPWPQAAPSARSVPGQATSSRADSFTSGAIWARRYRTKLLVTDTSVVILAVSISLQARFGPSAPTLAWGTVATDYSLAALVISATWIAVLGAFRTRDTRVVGVGPREYKLVVNASAVAFGLLAIVFVILQVDIARRFFVLALPIGVFGLLFERWLWRKWLLRQRKFGHYMARVIVVGNRRDVEYVVGQVEAKTGPTFHIVGAALKQAHGSAIAAPGRPIPIVSDFEHVADAAIAFDVDTVIVAGQPSASPDYIRTLAWDLEGTSADLVLSTRLTDVAGPRIHFRPVEGLPLIHVEIPKFEGARHVLKRTLDATSAGLALIVLLPVFALLAVLIKLDSPGPILFCQQRCGRNGRTFTIVKFRSMVQTAEDDLAGLLDRNQAAGVLFKMRNDPRITKIGRVLRKYSLDELPQLWNVFIGEMSLVGPRPPLPSEVESYDPHVQRRLYIKPGLTGMWQINGRSSLSWEESVRLDLYYVENWSLAGDLMIIWRTFKTLARPIGAY
ncbi:polyprenyl glycosylphosphotransferase [Cryobacterium roopkundense]|uniref:Polyprenyl glycosylphosphotransferase n=1 Tax=Cryobacterium roopkundense TaxID=1001240 RepID=A0A099JPG9_9MICO|nr:sugar transferase [Cryobacterium roopkundense]KGJ79348.1 polyprenyl glycosylphosphotransferase [Cryobacterium roopkundense]MBB5642790.1 exopolysaccharide biosynthesis polyprenyl glycosylphosphotransferase [Cryobacterium roopkundense]